MFNKNIYNDYGGKCSMKIEILKYPTQEDLLWWYKWQNVK